MTTANQRKHLKMVMSTVIDPLDFILDRIEGPGLTALHLLLSSHSTPLRRSLHQLAFWDLQMSPGEIFHVNHLSDPIGGKIYSFHVNHLRVSEPIGGTILGSYSFIKQCRTHSPVCILHHCITTNRREEALLDWH